MSGTKHNIELLVVDDNDEFRSIMVKRFARGGFNVHAAPNGEEAVDMAQRRDFDVAVFDMIMPGITGLELLEKFKGGQSDCEVILLTGKGSIETAVTAMKLGAFDYLTKPFPLASLETVIDKANERRRLRKENSQLREFIGRSEPSSNIVGKSPSMREVFRLIERAGPSEKAILIQGESGTGKELVARALHQHSPRTDRPLVVINCAALPETLLESELFGHEKGAFTGAIGSKQGLFEVADGGTLFIDEIGEMPGQLQAKLLRVLEDGTMRRVGSIKERRVDVRLLAATNRDMLQEVTAGRFREDLFYRINVMSLELPPLRERRGDIPLLLDHFLGADWEIDEDAERMIARYSWPGNVRQLINAIDRAKILADEHRIQAKDLPRQVIVGAQDETLTGDNNDSLSSIERAKIVEVLRREGGNKSRTARTLGIERRKLYRLLEKYQIS